MNLADLARSQSRLVYLLVGGMMWFGLVSYFSLSAREDPAILIRDAVVRTRAPGLRASQVESLVTRTLEESLREIPEVEQIRSLSMPEQSILH
ncbi:MAG: efflux RND transporter permease subunit, partial [Myxococcota bacterium]